MATKKKVDDFTKEPQAFTQEDVDAQDSRTRLWQSLNTTYGNRIEESNKDYDRNRAAADRAALSRGMGRSSFNLQNLAQIDEQKATAADRIRQEMVGAYQTGINQIEQQEKEDERWERQFAENQRQFNEGQELTRSENALNRAFQTSEREATQLYNTGEREAQQAYNTGERLAQQEWQSGENALNREFTTSERLAQQEWQSSENALNREQSQSQFDQQMAFSREQWQAQQEQWKQEFEYNKMSDSQKLAYNYVMTALEKGGTVSDSLLEQAGLSRKDYNAMKKKTTTKSSGKSGGGGGEWDKYGISKDQWNKLTDAQKNILRNGGQINITEDQFEQELGEGDNFSGGMFSYIDQKVRNYGENNPAYDWTQLKKNKK